MDYANPEVLVSTQWVADNPPPTATRRLVEVDYDPEAGYRSGHIEGATLIWWSRDINRDLTRDIINK